MHVQVWQRQRLGEAHGMRGNDSVHVQGRKRLMHGCRVGDDVSMATPGPLWSGSPGLSSANQQQQ